ncbi:MAG: GNAT family N-acetyltransferase [Synergistaceae bacterium]|nr:GNAT family N-acetyltransferase [Synergistaceae bacterium]
MDIVLRGMKPEDWPQVAEIYRQGIRTGVATLEAEVPSFERWDAAHAKECRIVAVQDADVVGWVVLSPVSGRHVYRGVAEVSVYVSETHRGQKVGRMLLNAVIRQSEEAGYWTLQSGIQEENSVSVALHHSCGFRTVGVRRRLGQDSEGKWCNILLLERRSDRVGVPDPADVQAQGKN